MKRLLLILVVALIIAGVYYLPTRDSEVEPKNEPEETFRPDPSGATFLFDSGRVTLSLGKFESDFNITTLSDTRAYGDLNQDNREDAAVLLLQSGGGSGLFIYIAALVSDSSSYTGTNTIYLGDRIDPQSLKIENSEIVITYLDRKNDEPMAAEPTVSVTKKFRYSADSLKEI